MDDEKKYVVIDQDGNVADVATTLDVARAQAASWNVIDKGAAPHRVMELVPVAHVLPDVPGLYRREDSASILDAYELSGTQWHAIDLDTMVLEEVDAEYMERVMAMARLVLVVSHAEVSLDGDEDDC